MKKYHLFLTVTQYCDNIDKKRVGKSLQDIPTWRHAEICLLTSEEQDKTKMEWIDCIMDRILKEVEVGKFITTAFKSILKLVKWQSLDAKC